jgi:predicted translin family RNA/ssDNA-binding protein
VEHETTWQSLEQSLTAKGATLADATKTQVNGLITSLEAAEKAVKESRDELNTFNNAIASGNANVKDQKNIDADTVTRTVQAYNMAMKSRQKLENKLFRVVIALGGKVTATY